MSLNALLFGKPIVVKNFQKFLEKLQKFPKIYRNFHGKILDKHPTTHNSTVSAPNGIYTVIPDDSGNRWQYIVIITP